MNELVFLKDKQPVTTSLIIAEGTGNEHRSIIRLIQAHEEHFNRWGKVRFMDLKSGNPQGGRPTTIALLNEQQATFLITLLRNNDVVLDFKSELVDRFYKMREILLNRQNEEWRAIRASGKAGNKDMCSDSSERRILKWQKSPQDNSRSNWQRKSTPATTLSKISFSSCPMKAS